jgi:Ca-activated chloride channel family protein
VYSVLVGTQDGVVEEKLTGGLRRLIRVPPSPETLEQISTATGGELFEATDADGLRKVYEELGSRLGSTSESREITDAFAAAAILLLLGAAGLSAFLFRRVL